MLLAAAVMIICQARPFGQPARLLMWVASAVFVRWHEEPTLTRMFGREYDNYRAAVDSYRTAVDEMVDAMNPVTASRGGQNGEGRGRR